MEQKKNKDWSDAVREKYLTEADETAVTGWEAIERRLHRTAVLRRAATIAAAVLIPVSALLLWSPWQTAVPSSGPAIAVTDNSQFNSEAIKPAEPFVPVEQSTSSSGFTAGSTLTSQPEQVTEDNEPNAGQSVIKPDNQDAEAGSTDNTVNNNQPENPQPLIRQIQDIITSDLLAYEEPQPRQRHKVSVSLTAGAGAVQRNMSFNSMTAPFFAKLAFMNYGTPIDKDTKINKYNIDTYFNDFVMTKSFSASFMPNPSTPSNVQYRHDLPLTFGLLARVDLLPWLGVESGVEYTYLHSVADSYIGTLDQRLHFIGVPVRVDARIWSNQFFEIYAALGGKAEKCVSATLGQIQCDEPRLQLAAEVAGGIQYRLWKNIYVYLQPELTMYMTKTDLITYRTENPLSFAFDAGFRFDL